MFSVIVPTFNRPNELAECLHRLGPEFQGFRSDYYDVIVTDDGQRVATEELCANAFPWVTYSKGPSKGPAANRNHGANLARHEWMIFIDDDCLPQPDLLKAYFERMRANREERLVALMGPTIREQGEMSLLWEAPHNPNGEMKISANFAITKMALDRVGRFDERFPMAALEDTEFFSRFELSGGEIEFVPNAIVLHPWRRIGTSISLAKKWEGKVIWALDQNASPMSIRWRLPWHVLRVIQSRFRNAQISMENVRAFGVFAIEWLHVLTHTNLWVRKWSQKEPSKFWREHTSRCGPPPKYGF